MTNRIAKASWVGLMAIALLLMVGCRSVDSTAMVGQPSPEAAQYVKGIWQLGDAIFYATAGNEPGRIEAASLEWKDGKWQMNPQTFFAATLNGKTYLNLQVDPKSTKADKPVTYTFVKLLGDVASKNPPDQLVVLMANIDAFAKLVQEGKLAGKVDIDSKKNQPTNVHLTATADQLNAIIQADTSGTLFDETHPVVLLRRGNVK